MTAATIDGAALHAAILADPKCDTARLAYADWLQENGEEERAEFIRVQVELAVMGDPPKQPPSKPGPLNRTFSGWLRYKEASREWRRSGRHIAERHAQLRSRESRLFHARTWKRLAPGPFSLVTVHPMEWYTGQSLIGVIRRGFVEEVICPAADWLTHADAVCEQHPVTKVRLTTVPDGDWVARNLPLDWLITGQGSVVADALSARWPHITFELPA